jgi:hypothetical protein
MELNYHTFMILLQALTHLRNVRSLHREVHNTTTVLDRRVEDSQPAQENGRCIERIK